MKYTLTYSKEEEEKLDRIYRKSGWAPSMDNQTIVGWHRYVPERETEAPYSIDEMLKRSY